MLQDLQVVAEEDLVDRGIRLETVRTVIAARTEASPDRLAEQLARTQSTFVSYYDGRYPACLRESPAPPVGLFLRGTLDHAKAAVLAVVGTRSMSAYGKRVVGDFVPRVAARAVIVSGLALGVGAEAHRTTIAADGVTWAVLGSGVDVPYPAAHRSLAEAIVAHGGALLSEFPLGTRPQRHHFPIRNRIIAGLSRATIVIEAAERSGSLLTARAALEANRDVFAVPGPIYSAHSAGPHRLIQVGAKFVHSPDDIFDELGLGRVQVESGTASADSAEEAVILEALGVDPIAFDDLVLTTALEPSTCLSTLTLMEMKGRVRNLGANTYVRTQ